MIVIAPTAVDRPQPHKPAPPLGDAAFVPQRVDLHDVTAARRLLSRDGAVILTGSPIDPDASVRAAAAMLGAKLRQMEPVRSRITEAGPELALHTDGIHVAVDIHGQQTQIKDHDADFVFALSEQPAPVGGESITVDGYRLVEHIRIAHPHLYEFMTTVDVDFTTGVPELAAHQLPLRVCRMVEWTRSGRMVMRAFPWAVPLPMDPNSDEHRRRLDEYAQLLIGLATVAVDTLLEVGEIQALDSYRCPHGVRAHEGVRRMRIATCRSSDSW